MPGEANDAATPPPLPSVFISYASADRTAARAVRDALEAAGLEVWFDEDELAGGEAWDAKIRNQIRTCTYFMPVISATTEVRREGYFRREWRLAVDRSHDMADDVMFLLPVVIDGTAEIGARVPEKFLTVQWLKLPGGLPTPALTALAGRLVRGEHTAPTPARAAYAPPPGKTTPAQPAPTAPAAGSSTEAGTSPALPPFPVRPANGHDKIKYFVDILTWILTCARILFKLLPKWARALVMVWFVIWIFKSSGNEDQKPAHEPRDETAREVATDSKDQQDAAAALKKAAKQLDQVAADPASENLKAGFARAGAELARTFSKQITPGTSAPVKFGIVPFLAPTEDAAARKFGELVIGQTFAQLTLARPDLVQMETAAQPTTDDTTLRALASENDEDCLLVARIEGTDLVVRLLSVAKPELVWIGHFPVKDSDVAGVAAQVVQGVLAATTPAAPTPPAKP